MKRRKHSVRALLFAVALLASLVVPSGTASATSAYDNVIEVVDSVHLSRDSATQGSPACAPMDLASSWASILTSSSSWTARTQVIGGATQSATLADWATTLSNEVGWAVVQQHYTSVNSPNSGSPIADAVYVVFTPASPQVNFSSDAIYYGAQKQAYMTTGSGYVYSVRIQFDDIGSAGGSDQCTPVISMALRESTATAWYKEYFSVAATSTESTGGYSLRPLFVNAPVNYPSGYQGQPLPTQPPPAAYVGMGDSFSSGKGNSPYEPGTDTSSNTCHRSSVAYPRLLQNSLDLGPTAFVACAGATTSAVTSGGFNGEATQIDALTSSTDLVTMTIAGNNIPFAGFARACALPGPNSSCDGQAYQDALAGIVSNVTSQVQSMLASVNNRIEQLGSGATVLVVGYPQLVPETWQYETGCWWLQPGELPAIRSVTSALNTAIKNEVEAIGGRFAFVSATDTDSPFAGHELCREHNTIADYFHGVVIGENEGDSFHPNGGGQQAYAQLLEDYLALHPLS